LPQTLIEPALRIIDIALYAQTPATIVFLALDDAIHFLEQRVATSGIQILATEFPADLIDPFIIAPLHPALIVKTAAQAGDFRVHRIDLTAALVLLQKRRTHEFRAVSGIVRPATPTDIETLFRLTVKFQALSPASEVGGKIRRDIRGCAGARMFLDPACGISFHAIGITNLPPVGIAALFGTHRGTGAAKQYEHETEDST
jgi:hypothetical protein